MPYLWTFLIGLLCGSLITWRQAALAVNRWRDHARLMERQREQMSDDFLRLLDIAVVAKMSKRQQVKELERWMEK